MKRKFLLLILSIFLISCGENILSNEKTLELSDGKKVEVKLREKEIRKNERILIVEYQIDERILKEELVEKQVLEIWKNLENFAEEKELKEALISSKYFIGKDEKTNLAKYQDFLFEAEKIENETWKIRKVN